MAPLNWLRRFVAQHRRLLAVALLAMAALALTEHLTPRAEPGVAVVVAAREVSAGSVLSAADLRVIELPRGALPAGHLSAVAQAVGRTAGLPLGANTMLQAAMLVGHEVAEGRALVPITLTDGQLRDLLAPGTPVTLVVSDEAGVSVVTGAARVAVTPAQPTGSGLGGVGRTSTLLLVDVPGNVAAQVAVLGQQGQLSLVLGAT